MKRLWICALCLTGLLVAGLPLQAQTAPSPRPSTSAADAAFLATLQAPQAPPASPAAAGVPTPSWASCSGIMCRSNCLCGRGCISVCTSLTFCTCECRPDPNHPGGPACQV